MGLYLEMTINDKHVVGMLQCNYPHHVLVHGQTLQGPVCGLVPAMVK
jgi:hypothetical protein